MEVWTEKCHVNLHLKLNCNSLVYIRKSGSGPFGSNPDSAPDTDPRLQKFIN
jgi:hypothetical protein